MSRNKFLGTNGHRLIKQLFIEFRWDNKETDYALYTLAKEDKEVDGTVYPSLYRLYMETGDPTEGAFVEKYFYDRQQWEQLCNAHFFKDLVLEWRSDLALKLSSNLVNILVSDARDPLSKSRTTSAKYLLENIINQKSNSSKRGRPKRNVDRGNVISLSEEIQNDLRRVIGQDSSD